MNGQQHFFVQSSPLFGIPRAKRCTHGAPKMNFSSYFVLSSLVVAGVVAHAYVAHEQFYPAVVYLSTDKMCLAVMYNFAFALFLLFGKLLLKIFIGTLRDLEVEQLVDSGRGFLADTILFLVFYAPTIDNREVGTVYLIQYICCVIFMKVFHLTTQIRVSHMFEVGVPRLIVNVKLVALMVLLLSLDFLALQYFYSVASRSSTFFTWILFEALTMSTVVLVSICKYSVHMVDLRLDNGWPGKSVCLFYIDLVHDVVSMTLFLVFMLTFFVQNPSRLPIYMMADVIQVARKLAQRLRSFRRYRRISLNMEARFENATDEEIDKNEHCVICRDSLFEGSKAKKLPCGHIFHIDCLRSWLVMQQVCPTCRAEIQPDGPLAQQAAGAGGMPPAPERPAAAAAAQQPAAAAATDPAAAAAPAAAPAATPAASPDAATAGAAGSAAMPQSSTPAAAPGSAGVAPVAVAATVASPALASMAKTQATSVSAMLAAPAAAASIAQPSVASGTGARPLEAVDAVLFGSTLAALPPVQEIVESLKHAEEIAKFLRQQTDFWMEQVRQIERHHSQPGGPVGFSTDIAAYLQSQSSGLLSAASQPAAAAAPAAAASSAAAAAASAPASSGSVASPSISTDLGAFGSSAATAQEPAAENPPCSPGGGDLRDQMAELRRAQKEQWERRRSNSSLGSGGAASP